MWYWDWCPPLCVCCLCLFTYTPAYRDACVQHALHHNNNTRRWVGERYRMLRYTPCLAGYVYIHVSSKCMATDFLMQTFDLHFYAINAHILWYPHMRNRRKGQYSAECSRMVWISTLLITCVPCSERGREWRLSVSCDSVLSCGVGLWVMSTYEI